MKSIEKIIKEVLSQKKDGNSTIRIDDSHFFAALLEKKNSKKLWNFVGLFVAVIVCATILIISFVFFINDVLLFENTPKINSVGAIIPERSCKRETAIFLFGSAQRWANTGIQLQKGDKIKISYSGGFNSDIVRLKDSTNLNNTLLHKWISFSEKKKEEKNPPKGLLFSGKDKYFGSLLFVIAGEMGVDDIDAINIVQLELERDIENDVNRNGVLYLAVNDIFLDSTTISYYEKQNKEIWETYINSTRQNAKDAIIDSIYFNKTENRQKRDRTDLFFYNDKKDTIYVAGEKFRERAKKNPDLFYQDNIGEVLVAIDITRKQNWHNWMSNWYRMTEYQLFHFWDNHNIALSILFTFCEFFISIFRLLCSLWYICIFVFFVFSFSYNKRVFKIYKQKKIRFLYMLSKRSILSIWVNSKDVFKEPTIFKQMFYTLWQVPYLIILWIINFFVWLAFLISPIFPYIAYPFITKKNSTFKNN